MLLFFFDNYIFTLKITFDHCERSKAVFFILLPAADRHASLAMIKFLFYHNIKKHLRQHQMDLRPKYFHLCLKYLQLCLPQLQLLHPHFQLSHPHFQLRHPHFQLSHPHFQLSHPHLRLWLRYLYFRRRSFYN